MKKAQAAIPRREFFRQGARRTGGLLLGVAVAETVRQVGRTAETAKSPNPFAYDLGGWNKTDPKLVHYQEVRRFQISNPEPRRIVFGPEQHLYVATKQGVSIVTTECEPVREIQLSGPARCVAVAADGTLYAGLRDHIEVLDQRGRLLSTWDPPSKKTWLTGLVVGETNLFAADSANRCVLRYDRSGKLLGRIGQKNKDRSVPGLIVPSPYLDVKLGADGLLRVNNPGRHAVEVYTTNGDLELSWGKPSAAIEGFCGCCNPVGLAALPNAKWVTCEKGLPRVKVYSSDGAFDCVVAGPEAFLENSKQGSVHDNSDGTMGGLDAATDAQGRVHILDLVAREVRVMQIKA